MEPRSVSSPARYSVTAGALALSARGVEIVLGAGDLVLLVGGGAAAAALWAVIGVGVGALVRNQVVALTGICAWLLLIEGLLAEDLAALGNGARFLPGAAAAAVTGLRP